MRGAKIPSPELYTGQLFRARLAYAKSQELPWFILSAKYGLVTPWDRLATYDLRIDRLSSLDHAAWHVGVVAQFMDELVDDDRPQSICIELHAGNEYCEPLESILTSLGFTVERPVKGLPIGKQLQHYKTSVQEIAGL
ncbi:hypothetical protein LOC72_06645 [Roseiconus lacunae]|nr:hypothetical protein [Roseiconus lacunae]